MTNRLLHAAARGARIQRQHFTANWRSWEPSRIAWVVKPEVCDYNYRIHPDDEHLQYGPISTALRWAAEPDNHQYGGTYTVPYGSYWLSMADAMVVDAADELHRSLFLLFLAEPIADEGM